MTRRARPRSTPSRDRAVADAVLDRYPRSFASEVGIDPARGTPSELFRLLCMAELMSARIGHRTALAAARALVGRWRSPPSMEASAWQDRVDVLDRAGYARYDESTATRLGENATRVRTRYRGDLRRLRDAAGRDPGRERELFKEFKGIGDVGVDILFRELQGAWTELRPFVDRRSAGSARQLGIPTEAEELALLVPTDRFPTFVSGLARAGLDGTVGEIAAAAETAPGAPTH